MSHFFHLGSQFHFRITFSKVSEREHPSGSNEKQHFVHPPKWTSFWHYVFHGFSVCSPKNHYKYSKNWLPVFSTSISYGNFHGFEREELLAKLAKSQQPFIGPLIHR